MTVAIIYTENFPNSSLPVEISALTCPINEVGGSITVNNCVELTITISPISHSLIRIYFSQPVINHFALVNTENYVFTPAITVLSVTPNMVLNPTYVDLSVQGMINTLYSLNILTIEAA